VVSGEKTGQVLLSSRDVETGQTVAIRLHKGRLRAEVKEKEQER
jgi:hypothetical protein